MAYEHESGIPNAFDREAGKQRQMVVFTGDELLQGAELNDLQRIVRDRGTRVSRMVAKDGDRREGAEALVSREDATVLCAGGRIFIAGDIFPVASKLLASVPMTGRVNLGVRVTKAWISHEDDPSLLGLVPGSEAEGEPGAWREEVRLEWSIEGDGLPGEFVPVYGMIDGTIIDQAPPPALTGVIQTMAGYDFDANGHYVVDGCNVSALGKSGADWVFSIEAGTANVQGFKRIRETAFRFAVPEEADLEDVVAETHPYTAAGGAATTVNVNLAPISSLQSAVIIKRVTQNIIRGASPDTTDDLQFNSATAIESVVQGGTTYVSGTSYTLSAGKISWVPGGPEPVAGSTYAVTYLYAAEVTPTAVTETSVTVTGGVQSQPITLRYWSKIPRIDLICLDIQGLPRYVKGVPARQYALPPIEPTSLLKLAEVHNTWLSFPRVVNNGVRNYTYAEQRRFFNRLVDVLEQFDRANARLSILAANPVAKNGIFTDNFVDDFYRDQGLSQSGAINQGVLQLAIDAVMLQRAGTAPQTLPWSEFTVLAQPLRSSAQLINPYANFIAMPAEMRIDPPVDFWTEQSTLFTSDVTREFTTAPGQPPGQTVINEVTQIRRESNPVLRQIVVAVVINGFGENEVLTSLTFDGVDVKPAGTQTANDLGVITLNFTIPPNIPEGTKRIRAEGAAGSFAGAQFVGDGEVEVTTMRRVTLITREAPPPVVNNITNITEITNITLNQITQQVVPQPARQTWDFGSDDSDNSGSNDPLAQTYMVPEPCMVVGLNFWVEAIGDPANGIRVQIATVANGYPTAVILAEAFISMVGKSVGDKLQARFDLPVNHEPGREYCFVILTDDGEHAVSIARLGDVIGEGEDQERVGQNPYNVGVMFTSANRRTWTAHQDSDVAFELIAANFTSTSLTVPVWSGEFDQISDLNVRSVVELPTDAAQFEYELVRADGKVVAFTPGQSLEFSEFISEEVTIRAVLSGTNRISPILYPGTLIAGGRMRTTGTYATRNFEFGSAVEATALFAADLPAGASVDVQARTDAGAWQAMTLDTTKVLGEGWTEPRYKRAAMTGTQGQLMITLTGTPAARPSVAQLRAYTI